MVTNQQVSISTENLTYGRIQLCITHTCQLKCVYCQLDNGKDYNLSNLNMSSDTARECIDFTLNTIPETVKKILISYTSNGEPLINWKTIDATINYCNNLQSPVEFSHSFATNGVLLTDNIIDWILSNDNLRIFISLDGKEQVHDTLRKFKNGDLSFAKILKNIRNYRDRIKDIPTRHLIGSTVLTSLETDFKGILEFLLSEGFEHIVMRPLRGPKEWNYALNETSIDKFKDGFSDLAIFLKEQVKQGNISYLLALSPAYDFFAKGIYSILLQEQRYFTCPHCPPFTKNLWNFSTTFDSDGQIISPCRDLIGHPDFVIGDLHTGLRTGERERIALMNVDDREICSSCNEKYICGGGCFLNNFYSTNDPVIPDPVMCELTKYIISLNREFISWIEEYDYHLIELLKNVGRKNVPWKDYYFPLST